MNTKVMFSSDKQDWGTPQKLFDELNNEFDFDLDVCAHDGNKKLDNYYSEEDNALEQPWKYSAFMNPPYERGVQDKFIEKAYMESLKGSRVVCLIPSRTDTRYFHNYVMKAEEIRFIKGRLHFSDSKNAAPFPSAIVIFHNHSNEYPKVSTYEPGKQRALKPVMYKYLINPMQFHD